MFRLSDKTFKKKMLWLRFLKYFFLHVQLLDTNNKKAVLGGIQFWMHWQTREYQKRENDEGFLQALVGRIMQLPTMQTFVIVASDTF